jgi:hypothetical protein
MYGRASIPELQGPVPTGRPKPDPDLLDVLLGNDGRLCVQEEGLVRHDVDGVGGDDLDFLDGPDVAVLRRFLGLVDDPVDGILDVLGGEGVAVVELDPAPKPELPHRVGDGLPRGGQGGLVLQLGCDEGGVEHVDVDEDSTRSKCMWGPWWRVGGEETVSVSFLAPPPRHQAARGEAQRREHAGHDPPP